MKKIFNASPTRKSFFKKFKSAVLQWTSDKDCSKSAINFGKKKIIDGEELNQVFSLNS